MTIGDTAEGYAAPRRPSTQQFRAPSLPSNHRLCVAQQGGPPIFASRDFCIKMICY